MPHVSAFCILALLMVAGYVMHSNYIRECLDSLGLKMRTPLHRSLVVGTVA